MMAPMKRAARKVGAEGLRVLAGELGRLSEELDGLAGEVEEVGLSIDAGKARQAADAAASVWAFVQGVGDQVRSGRADGERLKRRILEA